MKKIVALLCALVMAMPCVMLTGCGSREEQLKMYVPGEYVDEDIFDGFKEFYKEKTGKSVDVVVTTFDTVEEIITAVERDNADYDLLMPSDYAVEQLIKKDLLLKVDKEKVDAEKVIKPEYVTLAKVSDPTLEYSVPYMYGTFGIMYDYQKTGKHIDSWSAIFTDEYKGKSANKDSLREAITSAAIWNKRDELATASDGFTNYGDDYKAKLQSIYGDFTEGAIEGAVEELKAMKQNSALWGGEDLKFNMASGNTDVEVALMWSCDAGYIMNDYEDDDGNEHDGNRNIWYAVPKEGGNIYLDCFVISKYAKNTEAANYFLEYVCTKDVAMKNSEYAGAISPVTAAYDALYAEYSADATIGAGAAEGWREMYLDMLFPSATTIARCGTMRDFGDRDAYVSTQWNNVRG